MGSGSSTATCTSWSRPTSSSATWTRGSRTASSCPVGADGRPAARHHRHRRPADHRWTPSCSSTASAAAAGPDATARSRSRARGSADTGRLDFAIERNYDAEAQVMGMAMEGVDIAVLYPDHRPEPPRPRQPRPAALAGPLPGLQQLDPRVLPVQPRPAQVRGDAARARRAPGLPGAGALRARAGRRRVLHPAEPRERPLLALELLGPALQPARGARRDLGLPRGHGRLVLAHERALRREPLLPPRGQPLDRDAAGADRHDHRRRVRVPSQAPGRLPRGAELLGARAPVAHRVGLSPVPRHPRAVPGPDARRSTSGATAGPRSRAASRRSRRRPG